MEEKLESPSKYLVNKIRLKTLNTFMHTLIILEQINIKVFKEIKVVKQMENKNFNIPDIKKLSNKLNYPLPVYSGNITLMLFQEMEFIDQDKN